MRREDPDRAFWERKAPQYDRVALGVFGRPLSRVLELTAEGVSGAEAVLEVAAGTGLMTVVIAPRVRHVVATDYADAMLERLRTRIAAAGLVNVECTPRDIYALDYAAASFDRVVAGNVLHLVPDLPRALQALCHVLRPGGTLIAPTFCHDETRLSWLVSRTLLAAMGQPMHRRFTAVSLRQAIEQEGLRVTRSETVPGVIPITYVETVRGASPATRSHPRPGSQGPLDRAHGRRRFVFCHRQDDLFSCPGERTTGAYGCAVGTAGRGARHGRSPDSPAHSRDARDPRSRSTEATGQGAAGGVSRSVTRRDH